MTYDWIYGAFRCIEIKDRNGNKISATYDSEGRLATVTDTLGRVVTVNYGSNALPSSITQTWKDTNGSGSNVTHAWASFDYATTDGGSGHAPQINTNFGSLTVVGPPNSTVMSVLQKVTYADGSYTKFTYNNYAQVVKVQNYAADDHELNHVRTSDIESVTGTQSDCPRFTETKSYAENFNGGTEVTFNNTAPASGSYSLPGSLSGSAKVVDTWMTGHPDSLRTKLYFGTPGWSEGLLLATENCLTTSSTCTTQKRWTWTNWTQDNTSLSYTLNPRVTETRVGDGTNTKKTAISYWAETSTPNIAIYGLVKGTQVFGTDLATVLKQTYTTYNLDSNYASRRIIGLPSTVEAWGWNDNTSSLEYVSKASYGYDEENFSYESNQNISSVIQHDTSYSSSFYAGRGNLTTVRRWNVEYPTTESYSTRTKTRYDIAGSVVATLDSLDRKVSIDYADNFNDTTISRNTYAYPKTITDLAGNVSTIKYRFDNGANVWGKSPNLNTSTAGKESTREYDSVGRLLKQILVNNGAYTRYEYPTNGIQSKVYSTIIDTDSDGADTDDEVLSESWFDGAGRVRRSRTEHPNSNGGWAATMTEYDILGRAIRSTIPTEVSVNTSTNVWTPDGDDDRGGDGNGNPIWLWNTQEFDWKRWKRYAGLL
jgi:YD repeat-containing protein